MKPSLYSPEELLSRPIEHTVELLTCTELAAIIGSTRTWAWDVIRGERDLSWEETRRLRNWLASCARDGMVTDRRGAEVCSVR